MGCVRRCSCFFASKSLSGILLAVAWCYCRGLFLRKKPSAAVSAVTAAAAAGFEVGVSLQII